MSQRRRLGALTLLILLILILLFVLGCLRLAFNGEEQDEIQGVYESLPADTSTEDPLQYISEDFMAEEGFCSNLPIVILSIEGEITEYKSFSGGKEIVNESVEPYTDGSICILDSGTQVNYLTDEPVYTSQMKIKKRGHTSFSYDKPQYLMKMVLENGEDNDTEILGMGEGHNWILNGSMADKSMMRNYLPYRIASEIGGGAMAPDCRYCEVFLKTEEGYEYRGLYLLLETVSRGESRVNIDSFNEKNSYTSYLVRRDRFTNFDVMLDTYGRLSGLSEEWIGVKYPSAARLTQEAKQFIEQDFSKTEQVIYSEEESIFKTYDKYIDMDSFVDYFLINEFFGNYDAGNHSTYMYKNSGGGFAHWACVGF